MTTTEPTTEAGPEAPAVEWIPVGESVVPASRRDEFLAEVAAQAWHEPTGNHPFSPAHGLMTIIREYEIRPVVGIAYNGVWTAPDGPETATYCILSVKTRKQHIAFVDQGLRVVPVAILPLPEATA